MVLDSQNALVILPQNLHHHLNLALLQEGTLHSLLSPKILYVINNYFLLFLYCGGARPSKKQRHEGGDKNQQVTAAAESPFLPRQIKEENNEEE